MSLSKILNSEFRKELYKNLIDAGYEKKEAQEIVGKKYYSELHANVKTYLEGVLKSLDEEKFDVPFDAEVITRNLSELKGLKDVLTNK